MNRFAQGAGMVVMQAFQGDQKPQPSFQTLEQIVVINACRLRSRSACSASFAAFHLRVVQSSYFIAVWADVADRA
jgi:hypothetical protein